ncbi:MAG: PhoH family protein [Bacteroidia bacterium]|nr:PhoH family protein [Bacteroidia bacterium]HQU99788.1 PhoH family protein [Bacteroidia bacterium]
MVKKTVRKAQAKNNKKIFVLDTSAILFDHNVIQNFKEHDVAIPITVLEEVDRFKKGNDVINFEAREFIRSLDTLSQSFTLNDWIPLNGPTKGKLKVLMNEDSTVDANKVFNEKKADHNIINAALRLQEDLPGRKVVLISKDINLRLKAKSLELTSEDYNTGKVKDLEGLYTGCSVVENLQRKLIDALYTQGSYHYKSIFKTRPLANHYFILKSKNDEVSALAYFNAETDCIERIQKENASGIKPRNAEQAFAMHAVLNPSVKLVTVQGIAGTGKTLIALASALEQKSSYRQIYLARPIVPLSNKDIGYLPGDIKSKINPYMEPLWDNLKFIQSQYAETDKEFKKINEMVANEKLHVTPLAYIRGRSLSNICFIIDEAQNLTPHEVKTIITRAGENTKIIFTGDVFQIDTPYLDSHSNGLSTLIDKVKGQSIYAHITLEHGERSELSNLAGTLL